MYNKTEKIYYKDAYIREFSAQVLSCTKTEKGYEAVLDRTAFFPEEGGQSADNGFLGKARVTDAYEKDGVVYHICDRELGVGKVDGTIDFDLRFEKMQLHTAEHILCGIIHSLYGYENVGFHLGDDVVTFDISSPLTEQEILKVESLANEAVFKNIKIETFFPDEEELSTLGYRSKSELSGEVRIVKIGDVDTCACCAPHVSFTGEIGAVKILVFEKHRGGTRITMTAGRRALADYRKKHKDLQRISAALSAPIDECPEELTRYMKETEELKQELKTFKISSAQRLAESYPDSEGNKVVSLGELSMDEMRAFANVYKERVVGYLVVLGGTDRNYKYIIMKKNSELSSDIKEINKALSGRGGGRGEMVTGSFSSSLSEITEYFK